MLAGATLTLLLGRTVPTPAPATIVEALQSAEVTHADTDRSGFSITFQLGRGARGSGLDHELLKHPLLQPLSRLRLVVTLQGRPVVLVDGVITRHDFPPSARAGASTLTLFGEDLGYLMDLKEVQRAHPGSPDMVVRSVLLAYQRHGVLPKVLPVSGAANPTPTEPGTAQHGTDYRFVSDLAGRYGYVFFFEPTLAGSVAYWGPAPRNGLVQRALSIDLGPATNVEQVRFSFEPKTAERPGGTILDPNTGRAVPVPPGAPTAVPLSREGAAAPGADQRQTLLGASGLSLSEAQARAQGRAAATRDGLTAEGELDVLRYGDVLAARALVGVRGAGEGHDGKYYVSAVTHTLRRGQYRQRFSLRREGRGTTVPAVRS